MSEVLDRVEKKGKSVGRRESLSLVKFLIDNGRQDEINRLFDNDYYIKLLNELQDNKQ